ncbi:MAG TPA: 5'-nucleotidase, lipoprotein e(P4) family [Balneolaceae bacterium]|nr:5'-nucleotidase, lipoprotein e(P4) family [Balneolaceae bacterium]
MKVQNSLFLLLGFLIVGCSTTQNTTSTNALPDDKSVQATLWVQNSAEYQALSVQAYETAKRNLSLPLEDSFWTASITQEETESYMQLPPAIILDIDETVLDNSPFQARMIKQGKSFNVEDWNAWCNEGNAEAVPGAVHFTQYAAEQGVEIFYISNRAYEVEDATRRNMIELGFPVSSEMDNIMLNGEEPGCTSDKIKRRQLIEENYRVIMVFGDDLNDFFPAKNTTQKKRADSVNRYSNYFGKKWFVLPNPVYGSWENAMFDFQSDLTNKERNAILQERLDTRN